VVENTVSSKHSAFLCLMVINYRSREKLREPAAEMLGTMVLILFGNGVNCQVVLGSNTNVSATPKGDYLSIGFGWACGKFYSSWSLPATSVPTFICIGAALGVWVSGGVSGGHINPIVRSLCQDWPTLTVLIRVFR
jgi:aquaglyceroporin related protein, other eukaryote